MQISKQKEGNVLVVKVAGRVDAATSKALETEMLPPIDNGEHKILVDCSNLEYISSAGLRIFLMAAKKLKMARGKIVLCSMLPPIKTMFEIAGFSAAFPIFNTMEEGEKELRKK
ncbi:STAS domain-containing protein [candidate division KSB1 bacterium]|nr:STAS domain-containing protein [candidate division KSB1 bacterium]